MKTYLTITILFFSILGFSQNKFITKTGAVSFEATASSFEEVKAATNSTTAVIDADNGEFAALIFVKGFRFKNALMEEHFNENYAESDKYPKATFKGKLNGFSIDDLKTGKGFTITGELFFHGKTIKIENVPVKVLQEDKKTLKMTGNFKVKVADFGIEIPKVVDDKVSKIVAVSFDFELKK